MSMRSFIWVSVRELLVESSPLFTRSARSETTRSSVIDLLLEFVPTFSKGLVLRLRINTVQFQKRVFWIPWEIPQQSNYTFITTLVLQFFFPQANDTQTHCQTNGFVVFVWRYQLSSGSHCDEPHRRCKGNDLNSLL